MPRTNEFRWTGWRLWSARAALIAVVVLFGIGVSAVIGDMQAQLDKQAQASKEWRTWAGTHCQIVSVSGGGFNTPELIAYRCDDNRDYVERNGRKPDHWQPR